MTNRQKRGIALIVAGVIMILCAVGMHRMEQKQDELTGENSRVLLNQLHREKISIQLPDEPDQPESQTEPTEMPVEEILGYDLIGTIRVPEVGLELPVQYGWSKELLNVAPCRYSGSLSDSDLILMGHNYRSQFYSLLQAEQGMVVEFVELNGEIHRYTVSETLTLRGSEGELLPSDYPLTLFTCTPGGQSRFVVRCGSE
ncbi:MAG: sortase [Oscillospiraceae bacterium]|nr:sortase [Oscillospiraceae bacterium]